MWQKGKLATIQLKNNNNNRIIKLSVVPKAQTGRKCANNVHWAANTNLIKN